MVPFCDHFCGALQFLLGDGTGRVGQECLLQFDGGPVQLASFSHLQSALDVKLASLKSRLVQPDFVGGVVGFRLDRLFVVRDSGVPVLEVLGFFA